MIPLPVFFIAGFIVGATAAAAKPRETRKVLDALDRTGVTAVIEAAVRQGLPVASIARTMAARKGN